MPNLSFTLYKFYSGTIHLKIEICESVCIHVNILPHTNNGISADHFCPLFKLLRCDEKGGFKVALAYGPFSIQETPICFIL